MSVVAESGGSAASGVYRVKVYRVKVLGQSGPEMGAELRGASRADAFEITADTMPTRRITTTYHT